MKAIRTSLCLVVVLALIAVPTLSGCGGDEASTAAAGGPSGLFSGLVERLKREDDEDELKQLGEREEDREERQEARERAESRESEQARAQEREQELENGREPAAEPQES